jgi:hypothetical protein
MAELGIRDIAESSMKLQGIGPQKRRPSSVGSRTEPASAPRLDEPGVLPAYRRFRSRIEVRRHVRPIVGACSAPLEVGGRRPPSPACRQLILPG